MESRSPDVGNVAKVSLRRSRERWRVSESSWKYGSQNRTPVFPVRAQKTGNTVSDVMPSLTQRKKSKSESQAFSLA